LITEEANYKQNKKVYKKFPDLKINLID